MIELQEWIVLFDNGRGNSPRGIVKTSKCASKQKAMDKAWFKFVKDGIVYDLDVVKKEEFYK